MKTQKMCLLLLLCLNSFPAVAATWETCNGTPVRVKYPPMGLFWDLCSMPDGSSQQSAFFSGLLETGHYIGALGIGTGYGGGCVIDHDNGRSDVALVNRSEIDGALGLTITEEDGCTFSWEDEHIVTADVMIAADLNFDRADESAVVTAAPVGSGTKLGALVMLHELGHALGLGHSNAFAVMRNGLGARAPFVGMAPGSGGRSTELLGDDVFGMSRIYGTNFAYRNVYVSSQVLRAGVLRDNNIDPTRGDAQFPDPVLVCPGDQLNMYATFGNDSTVTESFQFAVYADPDPNAYYFPPDGGMGLFNTSIGQGTGSAPIAFTVQPSLPAGTTANVYVSIASQGWDRKGYDNAARSRLRIRRKPGC